MTDRFNDDAPFAKQAGRYFLTPVNLVPNGRAHLGHISGPLLRMDMLARHLRRQGNYVVVVSSSDVHESHVLVKAFQEGRSPMEVACGYHDLIDQDLKALDIVYDAFLNPLDPQWAPAYERLNHELMDAMVAAGTVRTVRERLPRRTDDKAGTARYAGTDFVLGGWLAGKCPACGAGNVSFFCETCGNHFRPEQMVDAKPRFGEGVLDWVEVDTLFLDLGDPKRLLAKFEEMDLRPDFRAMAERYVAREGAVMRLTHPGTWGVPWSVPGSSLPQVIFTYSGVLLGCHLLCGEVYGQIAGTGVNAFDASETVTSIIGFGIDNTIPFIVGVLGCGLGQDRFRPVDRYLVNYFYNLEGSKFSTNRGHVIWGGDIAMRTPVASDLIRAYLATVNPEFATGNFDLDGFVAFNNRMVDRLEREIAGAVEWLGRYPANASVAAPADALVKTLSAAMEAQDRAFRPEAFCLVDAMAPIEGWLARRPAYVASPDAAYWWLKGLALIAWPIMPRLSSVLWRACGHAGDPDASQFFDRPAPRAFQGALPLGRRVTRADLAPCLPAGLAAA